MRPDRQARLHRAVDAQAAEAVVFVPFTEGGYLAGGPDPDRPVLELAAIVSDVPKHVRAMGAGAASGHNAELRTASHTIKFTTSALPYRLAAGDRIVLLERRCAELTVNAADPFGTDRTIGRLEPLAGRDR